VTARPLRAIDADGLRRLLPWLLATWFVAISAMRLVLIWAGGPGFDGRLYRTATVAWLQGGDPWAVSQGGVYFAAPPPSLLPMVPFALLPESIAVPLMLAACLGASAWAIRRLRVPWWWLAFPPLVDGIWNANFHVLVMPLVLAGLAPMASIVKVYATVIPAIRFDWRSLVLTALALLITAPLLPWLRFLNELPTILLQLRVQSAGGQSVTSLPLPWVVGGAVLAIGGLAVVGRERAAWLAVPVLWPSTQWYYASIAIPGLARPELSIIPAAILAAPVAQAPLLAVMVMAAQTLLARRLRYRSQPPTTEPSPGATERLPSR
jgi:hypothetical protein